MNASEKPPLSSLKEMVADKIAALRTPPAGEGEKVVREHMKWFDDAYAKAATSSQADDWMDAALRGRQFRNAVVDALLSTQGREWQPIETAPDDGRPLIAWGSEWGGPKVVWADGQWWRLPLSMRPSVVPTHWMPLPSPPAIKEPS